MSPTTASECSQPLLVLSDSCLPISQLQVVALDPLQECLSLPRHSTAGEGMMCSMTLRPTRDEHDSIDLGAPQLYREDLEQIARIVRDECAGQVKIEFFDERGHVGDDPSAFTDHHAQDDTSEILRRLTISGERGNTKVEVSFSPSTAQLVVTNPDNSARGAASQIHALCQRRAHAVMAQRVSLRRFAVSAVLALGLAAGVGVDLLLDTARREALTWLAVLMFVLIILCAFLLVFLFALDAVRGPVLVNAPRVERPSFWQRHRKDVALLVAGGCIGYGVNQIPALAQLLSG